MQLKDSVRRWALAVERRWDDAIDRADQPFRFEAYLGHRNDTRAVVRGRLLRGHAPSAARPGEHVVLALRRSLAAFRTDEVPQEQLVIRLSTTQVEAHTDDDGYLRAELTVGPPDDDGAWQVGSVLVEGQEYPIEVRVPSPRARFGVISDLDDTAIETGVGDPLRMIHRTLTGSALTRRTFPGAPEFYRALASGVDGPDQHPFFYVSSSPWNLHAFLVSFLDHRGFPRGPLFLRDLLGSRDQASRAQLKADAIAEILELHADLRFVLIGDSGEDDALLYADVARRHPGRVLAVYIHHLRATATDRVDRAIAEWDAAAPLLVTREFDEMSRHATELGLISG